MIGRQTGMTNLQDDVFFFRTSISGKIFAANGSGTPQKGENALAGIVVNLLDSSGTIVATTKTDANGVYTFTDTGLGTFKIQVVTPSNATVTTPAQTISVTKGGAINDVNIGLTVKATPPKPTQPPPPPPMQPHPGMELAGMPKAGGPRR